MTAMVAVAVPGGPDGGATSARPSLIRGWGGGVAARQGEDGSSKKMNSYH